MSYLRHELDGEITIVRLDLIDQLQGDVVGSREVSALGRLLPFTVLDFSQDPPVEIARAGVSIVDAAGMLGELNGGPVPGSGDWLRSINDGIGLFVHLDKILGGRISADGAWIMTTSGEIDAAASSLRLRTPQQAIADFTQ